MHPWAHIALSGTWVQHLTDDASESGSDYIRQHRQVRSKGHGGAFISFFILTSNVSMDWQLHYFYDLIPIFSPLLNYRDEIIHQLLCLITYLKDVPSLSDLATLALSEVGLGEIYLSII